MDMMTRLRRWFGLAEQRGHVSESTGEWIRGGGSETTAGLDVTTETALGLVAVYACVRILSETVASLPLILYRRRADGGKERAFDHPLYPVLHDLANEDMTAFAFRETLMGHITTWGNGYAQIRRTRGGTVYDLWPLRPDKMTVTRAPGGTLRYVYERGPGDTRTFPAEDILHVAGLGFDGVSGYSPIALARNAIGLGMAADEFGARFFANDARPGVVLQHPGHLGDLAYTNLKKSWAETHGGVAQSHKPAILEEGMTVKEIGLPPQDAQYLETRKFQAVEIARLYRIPPHMIADLERATFGNIEQQSLEFVVHTLRPWLVRWEQWINYRLLLPDERGEYFCEFLVDALLRGDLLSRYNAYAVGRQNGWLSANDVRAFENMNPIDGGEVYLVPMNMTPASAVANDGGSEGGGGAPITAGDSSAQRWQALEPVFVDTFTRIIRREQADIRRLTGRERFEERLAEFYDGHAAWIAQAVTPMFTSMAVAMTGQALPDLMRAYAETTGRRVADESRREIETAAGGESLGETLDGWNARAERIARVELSRLATALTMMRSGENYGRDTRRSN